MPEIVHVGQFSRDFVNASGVDAEALVGGQGFAGDFQQDALEDRSRHESSSSGCSVARYPFQASQLRMKLSSNCLESINQKGRRSAPELFGCYLAAGADASPRCPAWC